MSRPLRIAFPGAWYHVMNRGLNRAAVYSDPRDYRLFIATLAEASQLFNVRVSAYCLMPNHYHLLLHTPDGNISRFMRHVNGVYTQRYNRKYRRDGPLFRGRFKALLVQKENYSLQVVKYIHLNPIKAGLARSLASYPWSSHKDYVGAGRPQEWLDTDSILRQITPARKKAVSAFKKFMAQEMETQMEKFYSKKRWQPVLGDEPFTKKIKKHLKNFPAWQDKEVRETRRMTGERLICAINREVCQFYKVPEEVLYQSRRGKENIARSMALALARNLSGLRLKEIARHYRIGSYKTVSMSCHRLKLLLQKNGKTAGEFSRLGKTCSQVET